MNLFKCSSCEHLRKQVEYLNGVIKEKDRFIQNITEKLFLNKEGINLVDVIEEPEIKSNEQPFIDPKGEVISEEVYGL